MCQSRTVYVAAGTAVADELIGDVNVKRASRVVECRFSCGIAS